MAKEFIWNLKAEVLASYTSEAGDTFENVIEVIHWRCTVSEGEKVEIDYSSIALPKPTNPATYVDLMAISAATDDEKKAMILGWADALKPGFKQSTEDKIAGWLDAAVAKPTVSNVTII